ncbi:MAG: hypothetical protein M8349_01420 [ANME-2 cluster archaeon]|nr:hypothetical protein [ANME-2 cluster archaeon]MDF1556992.1 pyruvate kinase alpha/beta domain-containing protein [ANME-2 cluster archaeon]
MEKSITYFEKPGEENTSAVVEAVKTRARELGIKEVVIASTSGKTGVAMAEALKDTNINLIVVTHQYGSHDEGKWDMESQYVSSLNEMGIEIVSQSHMFSGIEKSLSKGTGGASRVEIVADTLRKLFGKGFKVAIEVVIMAADSGALSMESEVIAVGGTAYGADVACVIKPAHSNNFYGLQIREIICMPREK